MQSDRDINRRTICYQMTSRYLYFRSYDWLNFSSTEQGVVIMVSGPDFCIGGNKAGIKYPGLPNGTHDNQTLKFFTNIILYAYPKKCTSNQLSILAALVT